MAEYGAGLREEARREDGEQGPSKAGSGGHRAGPGVRAWRGGWHYTPKAAEVQGHEKASGEGEGQGRSSGVSGGWRRPGSQPRGPGRWHSPTPWRGEAGRSLRTESEPGERGEQGEGPRRTEASAEEKEEEVRKGREGNRGEGKGGRQRRGEERRGKGRAGDKRRSGGE